jgi:CCR4-NOT transcription complex subunit 1
VTIAGISTRELVAKDFATEANEEKLRKAGHLMAQKLAGSLALVTCKEPLKSNLGGHLRSSLVDHGFSDVSVWRMRDTCQLLTAFQQTISEQVLTILVQDNVDVACAAIEKAAMERAVTEVDEGFAASYEARRRYREVYYLALITRLRLTSFHQHRTGQAFWDPAAPPSNFSASLPDPLRIKPTGLQPHQAAVYEDFGMIIFTVSPCDWS